MPISSTKHQSHSVLGGVGFRYETVELVLASIPHFELKQKAKILQLFTEIYNTFIQEMQEVLDERQNNIEPSKNEPFAFDTQLETDSQPVDLSVKSFDESFDDTSQVDNQFSNETFPVLPGAKKDNSTCPEFKHQPSNHLTKIRNHDIALKREAITPPKSKRHISKTSTVNKQKYASTSSSARQMTMTQLFDGIESPRSSLNKTIVKHEPNTPGDETMLNMPESLVGLAERSASTLDYNDYQNNISDLTLPIRPIRSERSQSLKRKATHSETINENILDNIDDTENSISIQNQAIIETPHDGIDTEELLYACPMCRNYWLGLPSELRQKNTLTCRHRQRPVARSPEHFWSLGIPNTQTCIERGYGGVLPPQKPIERPRRPRRQHQRILKDKQQLVLNKKDDDDSD